MKRGRNRTGFTLVEVLFAAFLLVLFPASALWATIRLEKGARELTEQMAAAAFCEDVYNRCLREGLFDKVDWTSFSKSTSGSNVYYYIKSGVAAGIYLPAIRLNGGAFYTPLARAGYKTPQYRIVNKGTHDVRVSMRWGPNREYYYQK